MSHRDTLISLLLIIQEASLIKILLHVLITNRHYCRHIEGISSMSGFCFNIKTVFPGKGISIIKIRRLWDRFVSYISNCSLFQFNCKNPGWYTQGMYDWEIGPPIPMFLFKVLVGDPAQVYQIFITISPPLSFETIKITQTIVCIYVYAWLCLHYVHLVGALISRMTE